MRRFDATRRRPVDKWTAAPRLTTSPQANRNNRSGQMMCYQNRPNSLASDTGPVAELRVVAPLDRAADAGDLVVGSLPGPRHLTHRLEEVVDATRRRPVDKWTAAPRLTTSPQANRNNRSGQMMCYQNRPNSLASDTGPVAELRVVAPLDRAADAGDLVVGSLPGPRHLTHRLEEVAVGVWHRLGARFVEPVSTAEQKGTTSAV